MNLFKSALVALALLVQPAVAESPRLFGSIGNQLSVGSAEGQVRYIGEPYFWGLQPVAGVSLAGNGSGYVGVGAAYTLRSQQGSLFARLTGMAGIYKRGGGRDLGGSLQFRTALDVGMTAASGMEFGIGADHRSNATIYKLNPGLNTAYLFATLPLR
ncbi:acyloxyacyl hydrolase [Roseinatronobacter alkalisoli]|uniref:Acyloxyacyl hydrolase n=1 Tax=Roseinatronobacter alkalisoli TaxID=3028235 RepID=A0ABT5TDY4_9RHOB|nr:acyloxyacyl hydrolase [Roseinatronobacter sp. HJB301]MDD7973314.1 acyloxyacyl hydrolase [Roseinatronobacter sp. HJB301]